MEEFYISANDCQDYLIETDQDFNITNINQAAKNFLGLNHSNSSGKNFFSLLKDNEQCHFFLDLSASKTILEKLNSLNKENTQNILWKQINILNNPLQNKHLLIGKIISDEKISWLRNSIYLENILTYFPGFLYWKNTESVYIGCNDNFAKAAGLTSRQEIVGKTDYDLAWAKTEADIFRQGDKEVMAGYPKYNIEETQLQADGKHATVLASKVPLQDEAGNLIGVLGIYSDITEIKNTQEKLEIAKHQAEEASKAKAEFIANMSRDFVNSLNTVLNMANLLGACSLGIEEESYVKTITETTRTLTDYVKDILKLSDPKLNKLPIIYKPLDLRQLIEDIVSTMIPFANQKALRFMVDYPDNVPYAIISDSHRLRRILYSLVDNALKFTQRGHILISVECVKVNAADVKLKISVSDTGVGIAEDKLQIIFERFSRLSTSYENKIEGAGLGLHIAKQFIEHLDGKITVESQLGIGSTFTIELLCSLQEVQSKKIAPPENHTDFRILLVDDSLPSGKNFVKQLANSRHDFTSSSSAFSMLEQSFFSTPYDIVVIDDEITEISPIKLVKLIRKNPAFERVMLIFLSKINSAKVIDKSKKSGFFDCFIKPIQPSELSILITTTWRNWLAQLKTG